MDTPDRPYSSLYAEHYWSGGGAEKTHVYLNGNNLPARFAQVGAQGFTVAELGFGTGLNLLLTMHLQGQTGLSHLTYISYEQHPLPLAELATIHAAFPIHLHPLAQALQAAYAPQQGWNTLHLPNTTLHLYVGDARTGIATHPQPAGCWYLDGFSPAANPAMWEAGLLADVYRHTQSGGTASTYSVARMVKENLTAAGFAIAKAQGHPPKQHILTATKP